MIMLKLAFVVVGALLLLAALQSVSVHVSEVSLEDPDEADVPDDYDCVLLEGSTGAHDLHITLTVMGLIQPGNYVEVYSQFRYNVGVWMRESDHDPYPSVYDLKYIEGEEQNYGVETSVDGNKLTFEFPLDLLPSGAYIVGLSAIIHSGETEDVVSEDEAVNAEIQKLIMLPVGPMVLVVAAALTGTVAILVFAWPIRPGKGPLGSQ